MSRRQTTEHHIRAGGSICPFARPAAQRGGVQFVEVAPGQALQPVLWAAAKAFCATWGKDGDRALVVVGPEDPPDFEAGRRLAVQWQGQILLAFARVSHPRLPVPQVERLVRAQNEAFLLDREDSEIHALPFYEPACLRHQAGRLDAERRAALLAFEGGVYLLFAGPQYPPDHFRHAPHFWSACASSWRHCPATRKGPDPMEDLFAFLFLLLLLVGPLLCGLLLGFVLGQVVSIDDLRRFLRSAWGMNRG